MMGLCSSFISTTLQSYEYGFCTGRSASHFLVHDATVLQSAMCEGFSPALGPSSSWPTWISGPARLWQVLLSVLEHWNLQPQASILMKQRNQLMRWKQPPPPALLQVMALVSVWAGAYQPCCPSSPAKPMKYVPAPRARPASQSLHTHTRLPSYEWTKPADPGTELK